jgi:Trypsin-like peptidase domain
MFNLDPAAFFVTNQALDYSIVALKGDTRNIAKFGWNGLSAAEGKVIVGEYVTIIQHPSGQRKQIALRENQIVDVLENFLHYRTDTAPGSSGSPVFNDQWEVVSLHHSGVPRKDAQGRILTKDGKVWNRSIPDTQVDWIANEGVRISRLLKHLAGLSLSGSQAALRKQVLDSDKGWVGARSAAELIEGDERETTRTSSGWTLPLQLTIEVGDGASGAPEGGGAPRIQVRGPETPRNGDLGEGAGSAGQDELVSAWQAHESASRRPEPLPEAPQEAAAPARTESPLEWLTRTSGAAAEGRDQFAKEGALW